MSKVEFSEIVSLFDPDKWDIGYLSASQMDRAGNTSLKAKFHLHHGFDLTNHIHNTSLNGIVVIRYTDEANNYNLYDESFEILEGKFGDRIILTYSNFKESALLSGTGHRAKNSLIYNRKFGFQSKICVYMFVDEIVNHENLKPNKHSRIEDEELQKTFKNLYAYNIKRNNDSEEKNDYFYRFRNKLHGQIRSRYSTKFLRENKNWLR